VNVNLGLLVGHCTALVHGTQPRRKAYRSSHGPSVVLYAEAAIKIKNIKHIKSKDTIQIKNYIYAI